VFHELALAYVALKLRVFLHTGPLLDSSFPRTRESRFVLHGIDLDTRFRGYDGTKVRSSFCRSAPQLIFRGDADFRRGRNILDQKIFTRRPQRLRGEPPPLRVFVCAVLLQLFRLRYSSHPAGSGGTGASSDTTASSLPLTSSANPLRD
jgi:hypothetical protein